MSVRAKFRCDSIDQNNMVAFSAVTGKEGEITEDAKFHKYTPCGQLSMCIDNPAALAQFEVGKSYYLDFTPAP